jgi:DNA processing protein
VWRELSPAGLFDSPGTDGAEQDAEIATAMRDIAGWRAAGLGFLSFRDDAYPAQLRGINQMPPVLFHRGALRPDERGVCVVGSRTASVRGLAVATSVATGLVQRGITVVSGLAAGIDTRAHEAALVAGGRTVAVIGTGIHRYYPAQSRSLQDRIAESGLVLSQFWPDASPAKQSFPMRNAVMSGYGRATIVVEAGEHSGARIQARQAVAHGRPVILTDLVMSATSWSADLIGRPGVYIANSTADAMSIVERIMAAPEEVDDLLATAAWE